MHVKQELEAIRLKNGGLLTEEAVVKEARASNHPLHNRFTWNDSEAAKLYRLEQARELIRSVYVTIENSAETSVSVRAYASLPTDRNGDGGYRAIADIMNNAAMRTELLATALAELDAFQTRFKTLQELAPVFEAVERVKQKKPAAKVKAAVVRTKARTATAQP